MNSDGAIGTSRAPPSVLVQVDAGHSLDDAMRRMLALRSTTNDQSRAAQKWMADPSTVLPGTMDEPPCAFWGSLVLPRVAAVRVAVPMAEGSSPGSSPALTVELAHGDVLQGSTSSTNSSLCSLEATRRSLGVHGFPESNPHLIPGSDEDGGIGSRPVYVPLENAVVSSDLPTAEVVGWRALCSLGSAVATLHACGLSLRGWEVHCLDGDASNPDAFVSVLRLPNSLAIETDSTFAEQREDMSRLARMVRRIVSRALDAAADNASRTPPSVRGAPPRTPALSDDLEFTLSRMEDPESCPTASQLMHSQGVRLRCEVFLLRDIVQLQRRQLKAEHQQHSSGSPAHSRATASETASSSQQPTPRMRPTTSPMVTVDYGDRSSMTLRHGGDDSTTDGGLDATEVLVMQDSGVQLHQTTGPNTPPRLLSTQGPAGHGDSQPRVGSGSAPRQPSFHNEHQQQRRSSSDQSPAGGVVVDDEECELIEMTEELLKTPPRAPPRSQQSSQMKAPPPYVQQQEHRTPPSTQTTRDVISVSQAATSASPNARSPLPLTTPPRTPPASNSRQSPMRGGATSDSQRPVTPGKLRGMPLRRSPTTSPVPDRRSPRPTAPAAAPMSNSVTPVNALDAARARRRNEKQSRMANRIDPAAAAPASNHAADMSSDPNVSNYTTTTEWMGSRLDDLSSMQAELSRISRATPTREVTGAAGRHSRKQSATSQSSEENQSATAAPSTSAAVTTEAEDARDAEAVDLLNELRRQTEVA